MNSQQQADDASTGSVSGSKRRSEDQVPVKTMLGSRQPASPQSTDLTARIGRCSEQYRIAVSRVFFVAIAVTILLNEPPVSHDPNLVIGLLCIGFLLVVAAVMGRLWCSVYLCGYKNRSLIDSGPYSIVRNPLYLFSLTGALGIGVASLSLTVTVLIMAFFLTIFRATVAEEENRLSGLFGQTYLRYRETTPAFIPAFRRYYSSAEYTIHVRQMNSAFLDVVWFFIVFLLVACLPALRASDWLISLMSLP